MSSVSGTQSEEVKTHIECDHCGFSVASVSPSLNRSPRCWRPIQVPSSEYPPHKQTSLVFAEATSAESEEPDHLLLILGIDEDDEPESSKSRMKRWLAGYGVSFFVHGIILLSAALIVYQVQKFNWHDSIQSSVSEGLGGLGSAGGLEPMQPIEFQVKREVQELSFDNPAYQSATVLNFGEGGDSQGVGDGGIGFSERNRGVIRLCLSLIFQAVCKRTFWTLTLKTREPSGLSHAGTKRVMNCSLPSMR